MRAFTVSILMVTALLHPSAAIAQKEQTNFEKGKAALTAHKAEEAIKYLTEAIREDPKNPEVHYYRGLAYDDAFEPEKAIADQTEALRLNPKFVNAFIARGLAHFTKADKTKAITDLTEAIKLDSKNAQAFGWRAMVYNELGEYAKAIADDTTKSELLPKSPSPHLNLARILAACPDEKIRDGNKALKHALEGFKLIEHDYKYKYEYLDAVAASYAELGKFEDAIKWQKDAIAAIPKDRPGRKSAEARLKQYEAGKPFRYKTYGDWIE
jgi:tetratricopeptide (TPR) repeat protein